ncbi:MAG: hypothetical protein P4L82_15800 [Ancalomicrobiaceae bacterium]|nr:hypothetical protein [Ancalomicrobiaceae bacterium]
MSAAIEAVARPLIHDGTDPTTLETVDAVTVVVLGDEKEAPPLDVAMTARDEVNEGPND